MLTCSKFLSYASLRTSTERRLQQIVLGWSIQDGNVVFPKTLDPEHMRQNLDVFDFELIDDEMRRIAAIPQKPYYDVPDEAPAFIADMPPFDQQL